jgi:ATP-binding cassette subfamily B protein
MGERLRALRLLIGLTFRADPARATGHAVLAVTFQLLGVATAVLVARLVDAAARGDEGDAVVAAELVTLAVLGEGLARWGDLVVSMALRERTTLHLDSRLATLAAGVTTLEPHERPDHLDRMDVLRRNHQQLASVHDSAVGTLATAAHLAATVALLAAVHPLLLLLPVFGGASVWAAARGERHRRRVEEAIAPTRRLEDRLFTLATSREAGKEIRVFGLRDTLLARFAGESARADAAEDAVDRRVAVTIALGWAVFGLGMVGALGFVVAEAGAGRAGAADVVLVLLLAGPVNTGIANLGAVVSGLVQHLDLGRRLVWLEDFAAACGATTAPVPAARPVPAGLRAGIRFEGVTFRYPGTGAPALAGVDLCLPAGRTVAVVGDNGAGKSTLVKLLCRFYDPDEGRITVDGVDLRSFDVAEWRQRLSAAFQDFARFELAAGEAVGVGDLPRLGDAAATASALQRAAAADVVARLPLGLATLLGASFDGGHELSTGEWQKLALGRAMMREAPLLLLLDEPTASLDARTEHALFERYAGAAREVAAATGAITVLVSHRFSTVRMADLIVVVDGGRVVEAGSHHDLVAAGGLYAELYRLQAAAYAR